MRQSLRQRISESVAALESRLHDSLMKQVESKLGAQLVSSQDSVRQDLDHMRKSLLEEGVNLWQRPVFDFLQAMQGNLKQDIEALSQRVDGAARGPPAQADL